MDDIDTFHQHDNPVLELGSLSNDISTVLDRFEERIQRLESIASTPSLGRTHEDALDVLSVEANIQNSGDDMNIASNDTTTDGDSRDCKRVCTNLIAKVVELENDAKKVDSTGRGIFDCHICLDTPRDPIVTCCGHMFCWPCFFRVPYDRSGARQCPVCKGEVSDNNITPVYGGDETSCKSRIEDSGLKVPPRPRARRIERVRVERAERWVFSTAEFEQDIRRSVHHEDEVLRERTPPSEREYQQIEFLLQLREHRDH